MTSKVKLQLQQVSDLISTVSKAAGSTVELAVESGLLQDTLTDICDGGGIAGSVFKLGAMALPDKFLEAGAEKRITFNLSRTFVKTLDEQLKTQGSQFISADAWKKYRQSKIETAARETLAAEFTWLKVVGRKSSRSWPMVHELADFARRIVWEAATLETQDVNNELRQFADDVRGIVHEALATTVDELSKDPVIEEAFRVETPKAVREALGLLAQEFQDLERTYLFNEIPQDALFIPPTVRIADYSQADVETDWDKVEPLSGGDAELYKVIKSCTGDPRVIVIMGEMGVGKSCLMRVTTAKLAATFRHEKSDAVLFVNWRDIYEKNNLTEGIAKHIKNQYGLPLPDLEDEERLIFLVDGFDEMRSHDPGEVDRYFESLVKLAKDHQSPLVVAMRSTIVTNQIRQQWKNNDVLVVKVDEFEDNAVDAWAEKWCQHRGVTDISGDGLRELCEGLSDLVRNPLLLFMLARYVQPVAKNRETALTRTEIFRTFVDETIAGKARLSGEKASISVITQKYRLLLQEIAWIASWPRHGGKCPLSVLRDYAGQDLEQFALKNLRSAFILHFFKPGEHYNEFEFHPEGFRHYLLAEWCVRTQWEALLYDEVKPPYPTGRDRAEAMNTLAQFPLREVERELINEIYEQLPKLLTSEDEEEKEKARVAFGLEDDTDPQKLYKRLCRHANEPPDHRWESMTEIGIPDGHSKLKSLQTIRLLTNYWDQAMLGTFGLYRGLGKEEKIFGEDKAVFQKFMGCLVACRGFEWKMRFSLASLGMSSLNLSMLSFLNVNLSGAVLRSADLRDAVLREADLRFADLSDAVLRKANLSDAVLRKAVLNEANLNEANLRYADLSFAELSFADLSFADLSEAVLHKAVLSKAVLSKADLREAVLNEADLNDAVLLKADLRFALLSEAVLSEAVLSEAVLSKADLRYADLRYAELWFADLSDADLSDADLSYALLSEAVLRFADLSDAIILNTDFREAKSLTQAQLNGEQPPLLCNCALPEGMDVDPNRDCDKIAPVLHSRYPNEFSTLQVAEEYVIKAREKQWD